MSDEFSLRPTRDPSARRRKLTPDAKHPSSHPRLRRPKGALCFTRRPPRIRKSSRSPNGDPPRRRHQTSQIETADRRRQASLTLALRSGSETGWILRGPVHFRKGDARVSHAGDYTTNKFRQFAVTILVTTDPTIVGADATVAPTAAVSGTATQSSYYEHLSHL